MQSKGYTGIYVVYDEFSKFLEANISEASVSDTKMLQDFAEKCNRSGEHQIHLMLISHKEIANYIDTLPKQKVDEVRPDVDWTVKGEAIDADGVVYGVIPKSDESISHRISAPHCRAESDIRFLWYVPENSYVALLTDFLQCSRGPVLIPRSPLLR